MSGLIRHLSILQSHVFLINSRPDRFTAALYTRRHKVHSFSRSYGVILPSSLAMNHSSASVFSTRLPVSVCGTSGNYLMLRGFSGKYDYNHYPLVRRLTVLSGSTRSADLPTVRISTPFNALFRQCADLSQLRHPIAVNASTGILIRCPSTTPFGFALGPD